MPDERTPEGEQPQYTAEQIQELESKLQQAEAERDKFKRDAQTHQSLADQRASRIETLKRQIKVQNPRTRRGTLPPVSRQQQYETTDDESDLDSELEQPALEAALLRNVLSDSDLTEDDIAGWEKRVKDVEDIEWFIEDIKTRKRLERLENAQAEQEPPSTPPSSPPPSDEEDDSEDEWMGSLSAVLGGVGGDVRNEVAQHLQEIDARKQELGEAKSKANNPKTREDLAAASIALAHDDPRKYMKKDRR